jgi:hypothetical protein
MTAAALIDELTARGVHLWVEDDRLKFKAPAGELTDEDKARLTEHKADLLALLAGNSAKPEPMCEGTPPYLTEGNELIIPLFTPKRYRYWQDSGQSIWVTLAELGAPLETWRRHAANRNEFLFSPKHAEWCGGKVQTGDGFAFCVECGGYEEAQQTERAN